MVKRIAALAVCCSLVHPSRRATTPEDDHRTRTLARRMQMTGEQHRTRSHAGGAGGETPIRIKITVSVYSCTFM